MSALLASLTTPCAGAVLNAAQADALAAAVRDGVPHPRLEGWKYTNLRALERREFVPATALPAFDDAAVRALPSPRIVFVNGYFDARHSDLSGLGDGVRVGSAGADGQGYDPAATDATPLQNAGDFFPRLTRAFAADGLTAHATSTVSGTLHLVSVNTAAGQDVGTHLKHRVELADGAQLDLVEHLLASGPHANLSSATLSITLGAGAQLRHVRLQNDAIAATHFSRVDATLADDACYERLDLELGAALSRNEVHVTLAGARATLRSNGVLLGDGATHLDTRIGIEHAGRETRCDLAWRGLGAGRSRVAFHGGIVIRQGADGSEARLSNRNLLLSAQAEIDTQPVLEIHADEVQAAHGATVGQLDATSLFYLRSRGIPLDDARALLTGAFCRETLALLAPGALRDSMEAQLDAALSQASLA